MSFELNVIGCAGSSKWFVNASQLPLQGVKPLVHVCEFLLNGTYKLVRGGGGGSYSISMGYKSMQLCIEVLA